ncbi:hypothetical protein H696_02803 [Fonticula alba]|uniref:RING-type domain-containing protein n=1 Tax=Fonticula alba TaxID=691883 RepID=A0A058ZAL2_FONAL|nr:hypothetical protein H696_02803 [Fonticula alba]KCV70462.1 hypothetical protein H696_02803 [Fonticula alba]|eukprot:XP_009494978.1 hypothetical protein H696_02803 [Fonticula alba]
MSINYSSLLEQAVAEWAPYYLEYNQLKGLISRVALSLEATSQSAEVPPAQAHVGAVDDERQRFERELTKELEKINTFYMVKVNEYWDTYTQHYKESIKRILSRAQNVQHLSSQLRRQASITASSSPDTVPTPASPGAGPASLSEVAVSSIEGGGGSLQGLAADGLNFDDFRPFFEFCRKVDDLRNYTVLNYIGFLKICRKYDARTNPGASFLLKYTPLLIQQPFYNSIALAALYTEVQCYCTEIFWLKNETVTQVADFTCVLCREILQSPLVLSCTHRFCGRCVTGLPVDHTSGTASCPICHKEFDPLNSVNFHTSAVLNAFIDTYFRPPAAEAGPVTPAGMAAAAALAAAGGAPQAGVNALLVAVPTADGGAGTGGGPLASDPLGPLPPGAGAILSPFGTAISHLGVTPDGSTLLSVPSGSVLVPAAAISSHHHHHAPAATPGADGRHFEALGTAGAAGSGTLPTGGELLLQGGPASPAPGTLGHLGFDFIAPLGPGIGLAPPPPPASGSLLSASPSAASSLGLPAASGPPPPPPAAGGIDDHLDSSDPLVPPLSPGLVTVPVASSGAGTTAPASVPAAGSGAQPAPPPAVIDMTRLAPISLAGGTVLLPYNTAPAADTAPSFEDPFNTFEMSVFSSSHLGQASVEPFLQEQGHRASMYSLAPPSPAQARSWRKSRNSSSFSGSGSRSGRGYGGTRAGARSGSGDFWRKLGWCCVSFSRVVGDNLFSRSALSGRRHSTAAVLRVIFTIIVIGLLLAFLLLTGPWQRSALQEQAFLRPSLPAVAFPGHAFVGRSVASLDSVCASIAAAYVFDGLPAVPAGSPAPAPAVARILERFSLRAPLAIDHPALAAFPVCLLDQGGLAGLPAGVATSAVRCLLDHRPMVFSPTMPPAIDMSLLVHMDVRLLASSSSLIATYFISQTATPGADLTLPALGPAVAGPPPSGHPAGTVHWPSMGATRTSNNPSPAFPYLPPGIAGCLLAGLLEQTAGLTPSQMTPTDQVVARYLSYVSGVDDPQELYQDILRP